MRLNLMVVLAVAVGLGLAACGQTNVSRSGRLLTMAAEEAGMIDAGQERLTRQLNIADLQIQMGQDAEGIKTLGLAQATLKSEEKGKSSLDEFKRIAGWTSVAELSNRAHDVKTAQTAYVEALEVLRSVQPESRRAEYVLSLSQVANELKGKEEACRLLIDGGKWATKISDVNVRRYALTVFTGQLVHYDSLDAAREVMRNEMDAAWRADTLAAIARLDMGQVAGIGASFAMEKDTVRAQLTESSFNKNVRYDASYRKAALQQGVAPNSQEPSK